MRGNGNAATGIQRWVGFVQTTFRSGRMTRWIGAVGVVGAATVLAGCGAGPDAGARVATAVVDTIAGVERWLYPGDGGAKLAWTVDTVARIGGALVEDDAYQFNGVTRTGVAADRAGHLYVLDAMGKRVLKYDSEGRHLATFGRAGGGPGELGMPVGLGIGPGDSIWVTDFGNRRYTIYPSEGGEARSFPFDDARGFPGPALEWRGGAMIQDFRELRLGPGPRDESESEPPRPILRLGATGDVLDTLWVSRPPRSDVVQSGDANRRVVVRMQRAFEPALHWAAFSDGSIAVSDTADYILRLIGADGRVLRRIDRDLPAREATEADRERERERVRKRLQSGGGIRITFNSGGGGGAGAPPAPSSLLEAQLAAMTFAPVVPRITGLRVDPLDRLWVGVSLETPGETERIDIFDREGRLVGQLTGHPLPDAFLDASTAVLIDQDELEVQQLVIYRIREDGGAER